VAGTQGQFFRTSSARILFAYQNKGMSEFDSTNPT